MPPSGRIRTLFRVRVRRFFLYDSVFNLLFDYHFQNVKVQKLRSTRPTDRQSVHVQSWARQLLRHQQISPQSTAFQRYQLRHRTHDRRLPVHDGHLADCNFITRLLHKNTYYGKSNNVF